MGKQVFSNEDTAVIVVDVQADFTEFKSGTLAVPVAWGRATARC